MNDLTNFNNIFKTQTLSQTPFCSYQKYYWKKVLIKEVLNSEYRIFKDSPLLVMDILVELEDGSYSNVKIQKIGYYFCG